MRRLTPTEADYVVIALTPALIITLVASLVFFLLEVVYQGEASGRLSFILAMFVMGATLISRISIEQSLGYAALFGLPLGLLTAVGIARFGQVSDNIYFAYALLGLVWWATSKLVWDCTAIDETEDASGQGLMESAGLEKNTARVKSSGNAGSKAAVAKESASPGATSAVSLPLEALTTTDPASAVSFRQWWQNYRKRPHVPGVWVLYFLLAAIPIFGIGQWFIRPGNVEARQWAFLYFCIYLASGLALLVTTSLLGIRRYLRQRQLEMSDTMALSWVATGGVLIAGVLLVALFLPRPNAEYPISDAAVLKFTSDLRDQNPNEPQPNRRGVGSDGPVDPEKATRTISSDQPGHPSQPGEESSASDSQAKQHDSQASGGPSSSAGKDSDAASSNQDAGQKNSSQGSAVQASPQQSGSQLQEAESPAKSSSSEAEGEPGASADRPANSAGQKQPDPSGSQSKTSSSRQAAAETADTSASDKTPEDQNRSSGSQDQSQSQEPTQSEASQSQASQSQASESTSKNSRKWPTVSLNFPSGLLNGLLFLLKLLLYVGLAVAVVVLVIKKFPQLLAALSNFWSRLFQSGKATETHGTEQSSRQRAETLRFAAFSNPFLNQQLSTMSTGELVRYTFDAFQAWGNEQRLARKPQETPVEYANRVSLSHRTLAAEAKAVAVLYSQIAYAGRLPKQDALAPLKQLWEKLEMTGRAEDNLGDFRTENSAQASGGG